eukprot:351672-Chlamydomonas_euryale.AAC.5
MGCAAETSCRLRPGRRIPAEVECTYTSTRRTTHKASMPSGRLGGLRLRRSCRPGAACKAGRHALKLIPVVDAQRDADALVRRGALGAAAGVVQPPLAL